MNWRNRLCREYSDVEMGRRKRSKIDNQKNAEESVEQIKRKCENVDINLEKDAEND